MVKIQVRLTKEQYQSLKEISTLKGLSMAAVGKFSSGLGDLSEKHDQYLASAFLD